MAEQERVAVRLGLGDEIGADGAGGTRLVLDDDRLPQALLQLLADQPSQNVGEAAGRKAHEDRIGLSG